MISVHDVDRLKVVANEVPPAKESYLEDDFVMNLLETVLDYQMNTKAVVKALQHFRDERWHEIRTLDDLLAVLARFPDDQPGNTALAQYLWRYDMWTRAHQLRDLAQYFVSIGVTDQERLQSWAARSQFQRDFEGRVKGLGIGHLTYNQHLAGRARALVPGRSHDISSRIPTPVTRGSEAGIVAAANGTPRPGWQRLVPVNVPLRQPTRLVVSRGLLPIGHRGQLRHSGHEVSDRGYGSAPPLDASQIRQSNSYALRPSS